MEERAEALAKQVAALAKQAAALAKQVAAMEEQVLAVSSRRTRSVTGPALTRIGSASHPEVTMSDPNRRVVVADVGDVDWKQGTVAFRDPVKARQLHVGMELEPFESFFVLVTDARGGLPWQGERVVSTQRHARIVELLCKDGDTVAPGQPLAVLEERDPTPEDYFVLFWKYIDAGSELQRLKYMLRTRGGALRASRELRRKRRKEKREPTVERG